VPDPDAILRDLLVQAIADCAPPAGRDPDRAAAASPAATACAR